jgi:hypothetical protein
LDLKSIVKYCNTTLDHDIGICIGYKTEKEKKITSTHLQEIEIWIGYQAQKEKELTYSSPITSAALASFLSLLCWVDLNMGNWLETESPSPPHVAP